MQCPKCGHEPTMSEIQRSPGDCTECGINYEGFERAAAKKNAPPIKTMVSADVAKAFHRHPGAQPVVVIDIDMKFWSMVKFMVKWAIAAIPAVIILAALLAMIGMLAVTVMGSFVSYAKYSGAAVSTDSAASPASFKPELIMTPGDQSGYFWLDGLDVKGSTVNATIRHKRDTGVEYSVFRMDCPSGLGEIVSSATSRSSLRYDQSVTLRRIQPGTDRHSIAIRACRDVPNKHGSL